MTPTDTKSTVLLKHHLKALRLPTVWAECEKVAQRAAADNADHLAFLLQLCELELIERERKAAERRLKAARFPAAKLLDEFDFAARPSVNKPLLLELVKGEYLDRRENILLVGPSGTGKSHLATALGMAACAQGRKVRFFRVTELITLLSEAKEERQLLRLRQQLGKLDLLIDDLVIIEVKSATQLVDAHAKQLLTYLRLADLRLGLVMNFGGALFKGQFRRVANSYNRSP